MVSWKVSWSLCGDYIEDFISSSCVKKLLFFNNNNHFLNVFYGLFFNDVSSRIDQVTMGKDMIALITQVFLIIAVCGLSAPKHREKDKRG